METSGMQQGEVHAGQVAVPVTGDAAPSRSNAMEEYRGLVEKAYSKFARLRELPPYGRKKWDTNFQKAFSVYSRLWKFQQEHRQELLDQGLKRWEVGEIASRIGQLYYNYYLRTSEAQFLFESYIFYEAILAREYFKESTRDAALANKQLRYFARFIVVCLLLNRRATAKRLLRQLKVLVDEYSRSFQALDAREWKLVVREVQRFMKADAACDVARPLRYSMALDAPLQQPATPMSLGRAGLVRNLRLQEAILATYYHNEVKFSELTLDSFRMLQAIEYEPSGALVKRAGAMAAQAGGTDQGGPRPSGPSLEENILDPTLPPNPHKYILYRPTVPQLLLVLATASEELPPDSVLLLYISASSSIQGSDRPQPVPEGDTSSDPPLTRPPISPQPSLSAISPSEDPVQMDSYQRSLGVWLGSRKDQAAGSVGQLIREGSLRRGGEIPGGGGRGAVRNQSESYLYPSDLLPFTRRPLFLIVDCDNSAAFEVLAGQEQSEPIAMLLSPRIPGWGDESRVVSGAGGSVPSVLAAPQGALFTFFLTAPLLAFCRLVNVPLPTPQGAYEAAEQMLSSVLAEWGQVLGASPSLDPTWVRLLGDPFCRQFVLRFIFCRATLSLHETYRDRAECLSNCHPVLPPEFGARSPLVSQAMERIIESLGCKEAFVFVDEPTGLQIGSELQSMEVDSAAAADGLGELSLASKAAA